MCKPDILKYCWKIQGVYKISIHFWEIDFKSDFFAGDMILSTGERIVIV